MSSQGCKSRVWDMGEHLNLPTFLHTRLAGCSACRFDRSLQVRFLWFWLAFGPFLSVKKMQTFSMFKFCEVCEILQLYRKYKKNLYFPTFGIFSGASWIVSKLWLGRENPVRPVIWKQQINKQRHSWRLTNNWPSLWDVFNEAKIKVTWRASSSVIGLLRPVSELLSDPPSPCNRKENYIKQRWVTCYTF